MLHSLLVGLGRSGRELHLPVLRRLREAAATGPQHPDAAPLFAAADPVGYDLLPLSEGRGAPGLTTVPTLEAARARLDPAATVVHLCTPPDERAHVLGELARLGFRRFLVEKPLGVDAAAVAQIRAVRDAHGLSIAVVAPWLHSTLTERLCRIAVSGRLGRLRRITVHQRKPRLTRSLSTPSHPTAFDVELPHSVGVALRLAGGGRITVAAWSDAVGAERVVPRMGTAELTLAHHRGVLTRIVSDLVSPVRERSIVLDFAGGRLVGHYPISGDDNHAQLTLMPHRQPAEHEIFQDDALDACLLSVYRGFTEQADFAPDFALQAQVVELLEVAKLHAAARDDGDADCRDSRATSARTPAEGGGDIHNTGSIHVS